jgi:hypothetical protein
MHKYFVSYSHQYGFGRCDVNLSYPILSIEDVEEVENLLLQKTGIKCLVLFWCKL